MYNIVIPMAGKGKRFAEAGYKVPKPFIEVGGQPMFKLAIDNLHDNDPMLLKCKYIIIVDENVKQDCESHLCNLLDHLDTHIIPVDVKKQRGMAWTVLQAKKLINNDKGLIVSDCDHLTLDSRYLSRGLKFFDKKQADGGIFCFLNDNPKWSYLNISGGSIRQVVEKQVISNFANTGTYFFKTGSEFVQSAHEMIDSNIMVNNEFYVAPIYNQMIVKNKKVLPFLVNEMVGLGTPEDLEAYIASVGIG